VIILSADASPSQVPRLLALGAHAYVTKPIDITRFLEIVDGTLTEAAS
jgi:AmiR/NasT family two-component response regulator